MEKLKFASLFTGIGGFEKAISEIFPNSECAFFSEIDRHAIKTFLKNFPENEGENIGDIEKIVFDIDEDGNFSVNEERVKALPDFDLLVGGSPCQDLSIAKANRKGLDGTRSRLFYAYSAILRIKKPKYFILENVASMSQDAKARMSDELSKSVGYEVRPTLINSALVSVQKRQRLYWTNWKVEQPADRGIVWPELRAWSKSTRYPEGAPPYVEQRFTTNGKANTLTTGNGCGSFSSRNYIGDRILTPSECELIQTFPVGWTEGVPAAQRYKQLGNAVNVETIKHILSELKKK